MLMISLIIIHVGINQTWPIVVSVNKHWSIINNFLLYYRYIRCFIQLLIFLLAP